jgi:hypothetical protein
VDKPGQWQIAVSKNLFASGRPSGNENLIPTHQKRRARWNIKAIDYFL